VRLISVKQAAIDVRAGAAPLLVVAAGTFAGLAPVLGLDTWVSPAAAVVALLSGASVIRADVLAPARARAAARAVRPLRVRGGDTEYRSVANALQIAAGVWAAPAHVLRSPGAGQYEVVLPDGGTIGLTPCHRSADHDFAVFRSGSDWPWTARPQWGPAEPGERISLVGWLVGSAVSAVQATVDLTAQESQVPGLIAMIGPAPPAGSSGSALVVVRTGRVVGILTGVGALDRRQQAPGAGDTGVVIGVLLAAVPERLRSGAGPPADPPPPAVG
jgi:hypothetical protein